MSRQAGIQSTLAYGLVILSALLLLAPFVGFAVNAFSFRWFFPQLVPGTFTLVAWTRALSARSRVPAALLSSAGIAAAVTFASVAIGLPAARALGMHRFRGKRLVELLVLLPIMVPSLAVGMGLAVTFLRVGLGGTVAGVALAHLVPVLPYVVLTLAGAFANYREEYEAQARTLGAGPVRVFLRITLPAVLPAVVVASLFAFLISWSQYILTMLIGGGRVIAMPVLLFSIAPGGDNAATAVYSLLFVAPSLAVLAFVSRSLSAKSTAMQGLGRL